MLEKSSTAKKPYCLKIEVYAGKRELTCGFGGGKLLGTASLDLKGVENRVCVIQNGWIEMDKRAKLNLNVRVEPDPRFVFQFDGEPECSPQVFQVNGNVRQAVFTCKFGFRNSGGEQNLISRLVLFGLFGVLFWAFIIVVKVFDNWFLLFLHCVCSRSVSTDLTMCSNVR